MKRLIDLRPEDFADLAASLRRLGERFRPAVAQAAADLRRAAR